MSFPSDIRVRTDISWWQRRMFVSRYCDMNFDGNDGNNGKQDESLARYLPPDIT